MAEQKTIIALEQALALPYATQRFVQLGWRVIRLESPAEDGENAGDPNRYIGADLGYPGLQSYYIAPNAGKEAITINLKKKEGRELLKTIIRELKADVFMCNTLPKRYAQLGIDFKTLSEVRPGLIWCGISAMGPDYPDRAGYDPALQALLGFTFLTGETGGKPVPCGIPVIDLKAGDEAFTQVLLAMLEQNKHPAGKEIHVSMAQCAASWLITALPQLNFVKNDAELFARSGNEHRSFIPCNIYPTKDGFVYLAVGNDSQWAKLCAQKGFESLYAETRKTNEGRLKDKENIYQEIGNLSSVFSTSDFVNLCLALGLSVAPVNSIKEVAELACLKKQMVRTILPDGREVPLSPTSTATDFLEQHNFTLKFAPALGEHNSSVLQQAGLDISQIENLQKQKII